MHLNTNESYKTGFKYHYSAPLNPEAEVNIFMCAYKLKTTEK